MGLTPLPKVRVCRDFFEPFPLPRDPYVINEWPLIIDEIRSFNTNAEK